MEKRKAQITIFIIIAVLIIIVVAIFMFIQNKKTREDRDVDWFKQKGIQPSLDKVQEFIIKCLDKTSKRALVVIGIQGGYNSPQGNYFNMEDFFIPYYYNQGVVSMPSLQDIETELSSYVDENLGKCIISNTDFSSFKLIFQEPKTQTKIKDSEAVFTTELQIKIEHESSTSTFELNEHSKTHASKLKDIYSLAKYITDSHQENPDLMCINCISESAKQKDLYVDFISFSDDTTLVMLIENKTMDDPYLFEFLNKYFIDEVGV